MLGNGTLPELEQVARDSGVLIYHLELGRQRRRALAREPVDDLGGEGQPRGREVEHPRHGVRLRDYRDDELREVFHNDVRQQLPAQADVLQPAQRIVLPHGPHLTHEREFRGGERPHDRTDDAEEPSQPGDDLPLPGEPLVQESPVGDQVQVRHERGQQHNRREPSQDRPSLEGLPVLHRKEPLQAAPAAAGLPRSAGQYPGACHELGYLSPRRRRGIALHRDGPRASERTLNHNSIAAIDGQGPEP